MDILMTIQAKNVAIAEMLGFKFYSKYMKLSRSEENPSVELPNFINIYGECIQAPQLRFYSNANWQFEALKFLSDNYGVLYKIENGSCLLYHTYNDLAKPIKTFSDNVNIAIFEALYLFSQYLKEKNETK